MDEQRSGATLAVAAAATFLALVSFTTPLVTLPSTAAALGAGPEGQAWILSSMSVGLGVALLPVGALGDDLGRRRVLVVGAVVLAVASALTVLAPSATVFVVARVVQGFGAAALVACSLGLLGHAFPAGTPAAARASGIWGASVGAGIAAGPLLSAGGDELVAWSAAYAVEAVAAVVLAVVARLVLVESRAPDPRPVDVPGVVVLGAALAALLVGLTEARSGFGPATVGLLVGGVVLLAVFVLVERRRAAPMLDPVLFTRPLFLVSVLGALANGLGIIATTSFIATVVERGLGGSALVGAVLLLAWSLTGVVTSLLARRLPDGVSSRVRLSVGLAVIAVGQLLLLGVRPGSSPWSLAPGLAVAGVATGVVNAALARVAVASVPPGRGGLGSGANNTARYVGSAIGVTLVAVVATRPSLGSGPVALLHGWGTAVLVATVMSVVGAVAVAACRSWGADPGAGAGGQPAPVEAGSGHGQSDARRDPGPPQAAVP